MPSQLFNTYTGNTTAPSYANSFSKIQSLTDDQFNSLVFDRNRHSIWAQGEEYGYTGFKNLTVNSSYLTAPTYNHSNYINNSAGYARRFIDGVKYDKDNNSITVSYTYAYESSLSTVSSNYNGGSSTNCDFIRSITVSGHQISYTYNQFTTSPHENNGNYVITYAYINSAGVLHYDWRDLSDPVGTQATAVNINNNTPLNVITALYQTKDGEVSYTYTPLSTSIAFQTTGTKNTDTTITNTNKLNVVTGFSQDSSGKITYVYDVLNTTHSGSASGDFLTSVSLSANGVLSGSAGSFGGNPWGDFLWDVSIDSDGQLDGTAGSINITASGSGTDAQKYVKDVTWNSSTHTLSFTKTYFGSDSGETAITPSVSGSGGGQKFVNSIIFNGTKNHTVSISYCANPAVVCDNNTVKRVRANGATLTFYSS